jgi:hypothetical protein
MPSSDDVDEVEEVEEPLELAEDGKLPDSGPVRVKLILQTSPNAHCVRQECQFLQYPCT